jgi:hypothetical protein
LQYLRTSGYRPEEAVRFWRLMLAIGQTDGPLIPFLATHPPDAERVVRLMKWAGLEVAPELSALPADSPEPEGVGDVVRRFNLAIE